MRNRITNCFVGISSQPGLGGPNYFIRNALFNLAYSGFKLHHFSHGDVLLHNTVVKAGDGLGNYTSDPFDPPDLRLKAPSLVLDVAELIPNINEDFTGKGPDLGAYEEGSELPSYGPRPLPSH